MPIEGEAAETLVKLLTVLDDLDDVQNVYSNEELSEADLARLSA
jgi:transcriptional/translational regulatory protein YebC/TACO1